MFQIQGRIISREGDRLELSDICEALITGTDKIITEKAVKDHTRAKDVENQFNNSPLDEHK